MAFDIELRAVVGSEDHQGILGQAKLVEGVHQSTDLPVDFLDDIPVGSLL